MEAFSNGWSTVDQMFCCETSIGRILGTEYTRRCTSTIYQFLKSMWHCVEKGNMEWNAYIRFLPLPPPKKKKLVKLCRILNNEIYAKVKIGKHLSSELKIKKDLRQGDAVAPVLFNVVLKTAIWKSKVKTQGTIFDKCSQIVTYVDNVVILGRRLQDVKKKYITGPTNK